MFLQITYFHNPLLENYKENTMLESIKLDLERFFIYYFGTKNPKNIDFLIYIEKKDDFIVPKFIFKIKGKLTKEQIKEIVNIFKKHQEENFVIDYYGFYLPKNNFLQIDKNINLFLKNTKEIFEKFIKNYQKTKFIDETDMEYKKFIQTYNLFLYLYYQLINTYKNIKKEKQNLENLENKQYKEHILLLKKRLNLKEDSLEKTIIVYENFIEKIVNILKSLTNK